VVGFLAADVAVVVGVFKEGILAVEGMAGVVFWAFVVVPCFDPDAGVVGRDPREDLGRGMAMDDFFLASEEEEDLCAPVVAADAADVTPIFDAATVVGFLSLESFDG
jgi:hypothetical protein